MSNKLVTVTRFILFRQCYRRIKNSHLLPLGVYIMIMTEALHLSNVPESQYGDLGRWNAYKVQDTDIQDSHPENIPWSLGKDCGLP